MARNNTQSEESATELVQEIFSGNKSAEEKLVAKFWKSLYFILNRRCQDTQLAADIAQDTFIVVILKARNGQINTPEALASFIRQTGINLLIGHFRKETRRATDAHGEVEFEIPDQKVDILKSIESRESVALVRQLISELKVARDKDILNSYFVREENKASICKRLELTTEHFDRVLFRARSRLKQLIAFKLGDHNAL